MSDQTEFGDEQDMAVADKERPTLGPTEGSQDVSARAVQVVPMPAFTDPHNPEAMSNSVNLSLNDSPTPHSEDYGDGAKSTVGDAGTENAMSEASREMRANSPAGSGADEAAAANEALRDAPEDRGEWEKKHWVAQAKAHGLAVSGNMETVKGRVEDYEKESAQAEADAEKELEAAKSLNAGDWISEVDGAEDAESLAALRALYDRTGNDYSTVVEAFDAKQSELDNDGS